MQLINSLAIVAAAVSGVYAQGGQLMINTPASVVQCQPAQVTFGGGQPPYFVSIIPGGQVSAAPLESLGTQSGTSLTWNADIAQGTSITFQIRDSQGVTAFSAPVSIQSSSDSSCVGKNSAPASGSSGPTSTGSGTGSAPSSSAPATTRPSSAPVSSPSSPATSSRPSASSPAVTSPAASASPSSAAVAILPGSAAGVIAALLAAVIA